MKRGQGRGKREEKREEIKLWFPTRKSIFQVFVTHQR